MCSLFRSRERIIKFCEFEKKNIKLPLPVSYHTANTQVDDILKLDYSRKVYWYTFLLSSTIVWCYKFLLTM